ncbi:hypothetical protein [uncultured Sphingomonas sp.]|uniref:hypothetical protein n=1 Tax=uncultured Sphingomonas sp. TaxID=158754 RepID=UPI0025DED1AC|nr:hypothetical protein [uncultured Sphingomonas sp.]
MKDEIHQEIAARFKQITPQEAEAIFDALAQTDAKETIYMIESPSPDDLYRGRNEGDALATTLKLAEINVIYYLAASEDTFQQALDDIVIRINNEEENAMPFIHISAHGYEDGLELTDGGTLYWEQITKKLEQVSELVGLLNSGVPGIGSLPRINLSLSSCSAYSNYKRVAGDKIPVQSVLGPNIDVGWCQSLIGFTTFFYQAFILRRTFQNAVVAMNAAAGIIGQQIFELDHRVDLKSLATYGIDALLRHAREKN